VTFNQKYFLSKHLKKWGIVAIHSSDFLLELYAKNPDEVGRQLDYLAAAKGMDVDDLLAGYSSQLARFKAALLADLP